MMEDAGVIVRWFRPLHRLNHPGALNHRTHRKVLIVDEEVGFTGGVGIADEWAGDARNEREWRDTHFRIRGPAVDGLRAAFLDNWTETDPRRLRGSHRPLPRPAPARLGGHPMRPQRIRDRMGRHRHGVPHPPAARQPTGSHRHRLLRARRGAERTPLRRRRSRRRGPDPAPRSPRRQAVRPTRRRTALRPSSSTAGVQIWNFQPSMLHAKIMTVDGLVANIGSANLNRAVGRPRRGGQPRRPRPATRRGPRRALRRRPRTQRSHPTWPLAGPAPSPAHRGARRPARQAVDLTFGVDGGGSRGGRRHPKIERTFEGPDDAVVAMPAPRRAAPTAR